MKKTLAVVAAILWLPALWAADEVSTFRSYVDTDICARLMLGPITPARIECSQKMAKDGNDPVLVRLSNNMVITVNKEKMIKSLVGQLAEVSGELKAKDGRIKLQDVKPLDPNSIPASDPERKLLAAKRQAGTNPQTWEKIRHELAMMPYVSEFDFISFNLTGSEVILTGWTIRQTNRSYAYNVVKNVPGVETITNNIDVLPLGSNDMQIRGTARAALAKNLSRYFWGSGSDIKIVVKDGQIILLGRVASKGDSDIAYIQCNSVRNAFKVFNLLRIESPPKKKAEAATDKSARPGA